MWWEPRILLLLGRLRGLRHLDCAYPFVVPILVVLARQSDLLACLECLQGAHSLVEDGHRHARTRVVLERNLLSVGVDRDNRAGQIVGLTCSRHGAEASRD